MTEWTHGATGQSAQLLGENGTGEGGGDEEGLHVENDAVLGDAMLAGCGRIDVEDSGKRWMVARQLL